MCIYISVPRRSSRDLMNSEWGEQLEKMSPGGNQQDLSPVADASLQEWESGTPFEGVSLGVCWVLDSLSPHMHIQSRPIHLSKGEEKCVLKGLHSGKGPKDLVGISASPSVRWTPRLVSFVTVLRESWCVWGGWGWGGVL